MAAAARAGGSGKFEANLGTLLRTCDAVGACMEIPMAGAGASLNVAVAGSLVLYRLAGMA
jgi:tRNA G18 (ribose-2'-O)-methylase SpoU